GEPRRDRFGRYLVTPPDGGKPVAMTRATTVASAVDDTTGLQKWMKRQVAVGMAQRPDLVAAVATTDPDDKKKLGALAEDAMTAAGSSAAATVGTALHRATELADLGLEVPEVFTERVAEYRRCLDAHNVVVDPALVEAVLVLWQHEIAGTADRIVTWQGRRYVLDLNTCESVYPHGFAIQLAIYAMADHVYDYRTDTTSEMPDVDQDRAIICHLPAKGGPCTLQWIDIAAGREALEHALWVRSWRRRRDLLTEFGVPEVPNAEHDDVLGRRRERLLATLPFDVKAKWQAELPGVRGPKAADEWTAEQMDAIERVFELPFTDEPLPADPPKAPEPVAEVVPIRQRPDLGGPVDAGALQMLRERARRQSNGVKAWIKLWQAEAVEEGSTDFKMGRGKHVTLWAFEVSRAAMYLARLAEKGETPEAGAALVQRLLTDVVGDLAQQAGVTVGGLLGSLSLDEATQLADLACDTDATGIDGEEVAS
ncbi:MAG: hypothetical protein ACKO04_03530, partial [Actinomycetes bacterium]